MATDNILKLKVENKTKHLEKYIRPQWTWKTYLFIFDLSHKKLSIFLSF